MSTYQCFGADEVYPIERIAFAKGNTLRVRYVQFRDGTVKRYTQKGRYGTPLPSYPGEAVVLAMKWNPKEKEKYTGQVHIDKSIQEMGTFEIEKHFMGIVPTTLQPVGGAKKPVGGAKKPEDTPNKNIVPIAAAGAALFLLSR